MIGKCNASSGLVINNNNQAIIIAKVWAGATVTASKSGVVLLPQIWQSTDNIAIEYAIFLMDSSLFDDEHFWKITAVLNGKTLGDTVLVAEAKEYEADCTVFYLFHNGLDNFYNIEGYDMIHTRLANGSSSTSSMTIENNLLVCYQKYSSGSKGPQSFYYPETQIDITDYSTMVVEVTEVTLRGNGTRAFGAWATIALDKTGTPQYTWGDAAVTTDNIVTLDLSSTTGSYYLAIKIITGATQTQHYIKVKNWYLTSEAPV